MRKSVILILWKFTPCPSHALTDILKLTSYSIRFDLRRPNQLFYTQIGNNDDDTSSRARVFQHPPPARWIPSAGTCVRSRRQGIRLCFERSWKAAVDVVWDQKEVVQRLKGVLTFAPHLQYSRRTHWRCAWAICQKIFKWINFLIFVWFFKPPYVVRPFEMMPGLCAFAMKLATAAQWLASNRALRQVANTWRPLLKQLMYF